MFDDPNKELERLQKQLLQDEEWFEKELDSAKRMIGQLPEKTPRSSTSRTPQKSEAPAKSAPVRNYANGYGQGAAKPSQTQKNAPAPKKKGVAGLLILAGIELLGILGLVAYWTLVLLK